MQLMRRLLRLRHEYQLLFQRGGYSPLSFSGDDADSAIGFARTFREQRLLVIVGRHFSARTDGGLHWPKSWDLRIRDLDLADYQDALGVPGLRPSVLLASLPVAVFVKA
jgi:maltooligosyltrehalose synthase